MQGIGDIPARSREKIAESRDAPACVTPLARVG